MNWDDYIADACKLTVSTGTAIKTRDYRDGAVVAPLSYEADEFAGAWFVLFWLAADRRFRMHRLDLGQARFRFRVADDVPHPDGIRESDAKVKWDDLVEALDRRFGAAQVTVRRKGLIEAGLACKARWNCRPL